MARKGYGEKKLDATDTTNGDQYFTEVQVLLTTRKSLSTKKNLVWSIFFVEQDQVKLPVYESITKSYGNVKKIIEG